ncbi:SDR family oxidoreductase [Salaquimonas pukyongi]|uniref:SDR family oxidoreductase n=1 Tax=Salaquimonas pukyongi TaxID=2712698 RepID=UPI00096BB53D|nr:SDR family oxidoreductase [Salaquimonas pukyongi]
MDLGIAGRKAIVCAGSRGLGRGCAEHLADAGCTVFLNGRNPEVTNQTARDIQERTGSKVIVVLGDISDPLTQMHVFDACPEPDILINNNGGPPPRDFRELGREAILEGVVQNMVTPIEMVQKSLDGMVKRRFGRIVNITSLSVYSAIPGLDLSSGARAGLTAFLAGIARTTAKDNVTINQILPGKMDTDRIRSNLENSASKKGTSLADEEAASIAAIPAGRFGTPSEFGALCAFLCSAHAGYMTGQNFLMDGGLNPNAF